MAALSTLCLELPGAFSRGIHSSCFHGSLLSRQPRVKLHQQALCKRLAGTVDSAIVHHLHNYGLHSKLNNQTIAISPEMFKRQR